MEIRHSSYIYMIAAIAMLFSTPFVQAQDRRAKELVAQGDSLRNIYSFNESVGHFFVIHILYSFPFESKYPV